MSNIIDLKTVGFAALFTFAGIGAGLADEMDVRVSFRQLPEAVQNKLADEVKDLDIANTASVWMGTNMDGQIVYTGRVTGTDGSVQTINVDSSGNLIEARKFPGPVRVLPDRR